jgi:hypothetical protein
MGRHYRGLSAIVALVTGLRAMWAIHTSSRRGLGPWIEVVVRGSA